MRHWQVCPPPRPVLVTVVIVGLLLTSPGPLRAQSRATGGDLGGVVLDATGLVVPGAAVTVQRPETGFRRTVDTGPDGRFVVAALPVGVYDVEVELDQFRTERVTGVSLPLGSTLRLDFTLVPAGRSETVTVTPVDTERSVVAEVVQQDAISGLPINGRNFISFALLNPGLAEDRTPEQGSARTSGLTFAGQRPRSNNVTVDGLDNNDEVVGSVRAVFSQEAVQEFQVLTNSYAAEFGNATGGVVNIVTKSGTNTLTGNLFGYFRDRSLNAKGHFEQFDLFGQPTVRDKAPFSQQQFGGTLGGPLQRDRTFYFLSFERSDARTSNFVSIDDVTAVRHPVTGSSLGTPVEILERAGFPVQTGNVGYDVELNAFLAKVDHQFSGTNRATVRVTAGTEYNENIEPWGGLVARSRGALLDSRDLMVATAWTTVPSTRTVNELRAQVARRDQDVLSLDPRCAGRCDLEDEGGPTLEVPGVASVGRQRFTPGPRDTTRYQVGNVFSWFGGEHQLKLGGDFNYIRGRHQALPLHFGGRYLFAPQLQLPVGAGGALTPISAIQAVALGLPAAYVQGYGFSGEASDYQDVALFVQDRWSPTSRVTVDLGLRYQRQYRPGARLDVTGYPEPYRLPEDASDLAPRLAVAWDPTGRGTMSLHGAYGVFYDSVITAPSGTSQFINGAADGVRTLVLPAPASFATWLAPGRVIPEPVTPFASVTISLDPGFHTPYAHHVSAGVDRQVGTLSLGADVVLVRGSNHLGAIDYNPILADLCPSPGPGCVSRPEDVGGVPGTSASVIQATSWGESWYSGLILSARQRFNGRYQLSTSYTLSKAEDTSTDFHAGFVPQNNGRGRDPNDVNGLPVDFDPLAEKGPAINDQRHRLVVSGVYMAPADIQVSSILTVASGTPFNILAGADLNRDGNAGGFPPDRPRRDLRDESTSIGRNAGRFPTQATLDLRVSRRFDWSGAGRVDAIFEVFNLFNRTNFIGVQNIFGTGVYPAEPLPTYGRFTQAAAPRQAQVAVRVSF